MVTRGDIQMNDAAKLATKRTVRMALTFAAIFAIALGAPQLLGRTAGFVVTGAMLLAFIWVTNYRATKQRQSCRTTDEKRGMDAEPGSSETPPVLAGHPADEQSGTRRPAHGSSGGE
jgi:hypothetical protein